MPLMRKWLSKRSSLQRLPH